MIIDVHAHLFMPPSQWGFRGNLLGDRAASGRPAYEPADDEIAKCAVDNVAAMDEVGTDVQFVSPRPFIQMHSEKPAEIVHWWAEANNDTIARIVAERPDRFQGLAALPQVDGEPVQVCLPELERSINDLGFVGIVLNPDPGEGRGETPSLGDAYWYPLYEKLCELDVPALVHSAGCTRRETYSEHFISEESLAVTSLAQSEVFRQFPDLKLIISHGGGSAPYQVGRWRAASLMPALGGGDDRELFDHSMRRLWFDTCHLTRKSIELLIDVVSADRVVFGTERPGSGSVVDPFTGRDIDDTKPLINEIESLRGEERAAIFEWNARGLFTRLHGRI